MKEDTIHTLLCLLGVGFLLTGLGLLLLNMFFKPAVNLLPYGLGCVLAGNLINTIRNIRLKKNK